MKHDFIITLALVFLIGAFEGSPLNAQRLTRERLSFNADWRFQKGDPAGTEGQLAYDKVKPWVIATGNNFLSRGEKPGRPAGNLGNDILYAQRSFDDRTWR